MLIDLNDKPDHVHYGFLLGNELLHIRWEDSNSVWELGTPIAGERTYGEWVTYSIKQLLHMYLDPTHYSTTSSRDRPLPTYGKARPVAVHTWCNGGWMHKAYIPIEVPTLLPYMDAIHAEVTTVRMVVELAGEVTRELYAYKPSSTAPENTALAVGDRYYSADYGELKVYECITALGDQYLLLLLEDDELASKLVG